MNGAIFDRRKSFTAPVTRGFQLAGNSKADSPETENTEPNTPETTPFSTEETRFSLPTSPARQLIW
jgi:hypothetical protein